MVTSLPSELLDLIFESLCDTPTALKPCSLVSTTWHAAAATVLFSSLSLLCSVGEPDPTCPPPKFKRHFGFRYGLPIYRKTRSFNVVDTHCICHHYKDRTAHLFLASGASSSAHITRNVAELTLNFCRSSSEAVYHGPHSLQLYPDPFIYSLLQLVDEFSFTHLRFLNIDCAPQVLYFLESLEPFGGILSSAAQSLEEIRFSGFDSMQNTDIRRILNKHGFSCVRFPHLRSLVFQGLLGTEVSPGDTRKMNCVLELGRRYSTTHGVSADSVDVFYSYWDSSRLTGDQQPDGFSRFEIPNWCCFSGPCRKLEQLNRTGSLADFMGLGSIKWTLPTIGTVLHALQSDTLGQFAHTLQITISSTDAVGPKLLAYITQTFPRVSSLALCFNTAADVDQVIPSGKA